MTATAHDKARQMLKNASLYCTEARVAILQVLMQAARPLRQDQIAAPSARRTFDKVTVYRTLESLVEAGLVMKENNALSSTACPESDRTSTVPRSIVSGAFG